MLEKINKMSTLLTLAHFSLACAVCTFKSNLERLFGRKWHELCLPRGSYIRQVIGLSFFTREVEFQPYSKAEDQVVSTLIISSVNLSTQKNISVLKHQEINQSKMNAWLFYLIDGRASNSTRNRNELEDDVVILTPETVDLIRFWGVIHPCWWDISHCYANVLTFLP